MGIQDPYHTSTFYQEKDSYIFELYPFVDLIEHAFTDHPVAVRSGGHAVVPQRHSGHVNGEVAVGIGLGIPTIRCAGIAMDDYMRLAMGPPSSDWSPSSPPPRGRKSSAAWAVLFKVTSLSVEVEGVFGLPAVSCHSSRDLSYHCAGGGHTRHGHIVGGARAGDRGCGGPGRAVEGYITGSEAGNRFAEYHREVDGAGGGGIVLACRLVDGDGRRRHVIFHGVVGGGGGGVLFVTGCVLCHSAEL